MVLVEPLEVVAHQDKEIQVEDMVVLMEELVAVVKMALAVEEAVEAVDLLETVQSLVLL